MLFVSLGIAFRIRWLSYTIFYIGVIASSILRSFFLSCSEENNGRFSWDDIRFGKKTNKE